MRRRTFLAFAATAATLPAAARAADPNRTPDGDVYEAGWSPQSPLHFGEYVFDRPAAARLPPGAYQIHAAAWVRNGPARLAILAGGHTVSAVETVDAFGMSNPVLTCGVTACVVVPAGGELVEIAADGDVVRCTAVVRRIGDLTVPSDDE